MVAGYSEFSARQPHCTSLQWRDVKGRRKAGRNSGMKINGFKQRRRNREGATADKQDLKGVAERLRGGGGVPRRRRRNRDKGAGRKGGAGGESDPGAGCDPSGVKRGSSSEVIIDNSG